MTNYTVPHAMQMAYTPNINIFPSHFLLVDTMSDSFSAIPNYLPNVEIILSSWSDINPIGPSLLDDIQNQTHSSDVNSSESCLKQTSSASAQGNCFGPKAKVVTSDGNSMSWRGEKKKKTVSAGLLIALGIAGIVIGG